MKIYMVNPSQGKTFLGLEEAVKWVGCETAWMPLGIVTVAAIAENAGHEVTIVDAAFQEVDFGTDADVICLSLQIVQREDAFRIAREFRNRGKYVVMGGAHVTSAPEECKEHADTIIIGEAEYALPQFLDDYAREQPKRIYASVRKVDMRDSPVPAFHLVDTKKYYHAALNFTRGCPFNCEFCEIKEEWFAGRKVRAKNTEQILDELAVLKSLGVKKIFFHDDNFVGSPPKTKELLRALSEWQDRNDYNFNFLAEVSLNVSRDDELLDLLTKANITLLYIGIESPFEQSLRVAKKTQNIVGDMLEHIRKIQRRGIIVSAGMITGFDADTKEIFPKMYEFIQKSGIYLTTLWPLLAFPRTALARRLEHEGRLLDKGALHPALYRTSRAEMAINFMPKHMTPEELIEGTNWVIAKIYSHKGFAERLWQNIKNIGEGADNIAQLTAAELARIPLSTKIRFIKKVFFSSPAQFYYNMKTIIRVALRCPKLLLFCTTAFGTHSHIYSYYKDLIGNLDNVGECPIH
jgi:radical SAM superfamily enzyme YgiQ (UPF0313 family)